MQPTFFCPSCGSPNYIGQSFCGKCKRKLQYNCPYCSAIVDPTYMTCPNCRKPLNWPKRPKSPPRVKRQATQSEGQRLKPLHTKVVGVAQKNADGTKRQDILKTCRKGEQLMLIHEPIPQDENAIKICRQSGEQIGWLNQALAAEIAPRLAEGSIAGVKIAEITGGGFLFGNIRGCNIQIINSSTE